jgi:hypothetical protein
MPTLDFDKHLSAVLDEATVGAEEGDEDWREIKETIETMIFDD